ncbi:unnamed protein product [Caenorhabditis auriculariae]|uniref:Major facilitator superfamily (MFS) profile domain-containing protein n=1 Tax=Caenorhabditis auriculariae TaxID=2777116 RepID=A0A8S1HL88_9PELO|nr:unnamed protein product [Caenorhabditis auriculariae]
MRESLVSPRTSSSAAVSESQNQPPKVLVNTSEGLSPSTKVLISKLENKMLRQSRSLMTLIFGKRKERGEKGHPYQEASVLHALVVIFLEYFAWGLLTVPVINVLAETFPTNKFLMNGLVLGVKGILSFLSAPLVGALSDVWGRKIFLILTVLCTCMPIPCLKISPWWYFSLFSISGLFSVTFSVILAYVADITDKQERSSAYGLVSATFAASLVTSPALGAYISERHGDSVVVLLATAVAVVDIVFIVLFVPESLPSRRGPCGPSSGQVSSQEVFNWHSADPFGSLRIVWEDRLVLQLALIVFLSYLPESGQFSCFFVYLKLVVGFSPEAVAMYIGLVGILSVVAQTALLLLLSNYFGTKHTITLGLVFQLVQLTWYGLGTQNWMMWSAGVLAAMSSITYPSISAFVSILSDKDKQGTVQGVITGIRGLCTGFGPALFGFVFYLFDVDLEDDKDGAGHVGVGPHFPAVVAARLRSGVHEKILSPSRNESIWDDRPAFDWQLIPGPPFLIGAMMVLCALLINSTLPATPPASKYFRKSPTHSRQSSDTARLLSSDSSPHC